MKDLHRVAEALHIMMATLHFVGVVYAVVRQNRGDALVHTGALVFSVNAAVHHGRAQT